MELNLANGRRVRVKHTSGMFRVKIDGQDYCAQSLDILKTGLRASNLLAAEPVELSVQFVPPKHPLPKYDEPVVLPPLEQAVRDLVHGQHLKEKQRGLRNLSGMQHPLATHILSKPLSKEAEQLGTKLKKHFLFTTPEEMTENVNNLVLRGKLMQEMIRLFQIVNDQ